MNNYKHSELYREDLVARIKADILLPNDLEISDAIFSLLDKYRGLFLDWEIVLLSVEKTDDPMVTYSKLIDLLKQHEKSFPRKRTTPP